jgi:hypothetical protein
LDTLTFPATTIDNISHSFHGGLIEQEQSPVSVSHKLACLNASLVQQE